MTEKGETSEASANASANGPTKGGARVSDDGAKFDQIGALGHAGWLLSRSADPAHRDLFINDLEWAVMPPLALGQMRIWRQNNMPVALATWAFLGSEQEKRLEAGGRKLAPLDWQSGDGAWIIDLVTPFGGREEMLQELKDTVFKGRSVKVLE